RRSLSLICIRMLCSQLPDNKKTPIPIRDGGVCSHARGATLVGCRPDNPLCGVRSPQQVTSLPLPHNGGVPGAAYSGGPPPFGAQLPEPFPASADTGVAASHRLSAIVCGQVLVPIRVVPRFTCRVILAPGPPFC